VNDVTTTSIVIPTLNRPEFLRKLLISILCQTSLPKEIIVVDDSENDQTSKMVKENSNIFLSKGISLKYSRGNKENRSISAARNLGATKSTGEIVLFLDDDVILENKYLEEVLKTYEEYPMAKGVQGYIVSEAVPLSNFRSILVNSVNRIFHMGYTVEKNKCVYRLGWTYPYSPDRIIQCNWLHGSNMSLKREVLQSFRFDENLRRRSIGEDLDLSYRIYKRYPDSLLMNSNAKLNHESNLKASKSLAYRDTAYFVYLFFKNYEQTIQNRVLLLWTLLGRLILGRGLFLILSRNLKPVFWSVGSYVCMLSHFNNVKKGDFRFLDSII
jgi:glycosyltransferase involved in cell wall biosynthesis